MPLLLLLGATSTAGTLHFGWTAGDRAEVTYAIEGTREQPFGTLTFSRTVVYEVEVVASGDTLELRRTGWNETARTTKPAGVGGLVVQDWVDDLQARVPVVVLKPDGDYVGVAGGDALRAEAGKDFDGAKLDPTTRGLLDGMVADPSLAAMGGDWWAMAGGVWRRRSDKAGSRFEVTNRTPIPVLGGELDLVLAFEVVGPVDCAPGVAGCVELRSTSTPNAEQLATLLAAANQGAFELGNTVTLVTDPATLLPRKLVSARVTRGGGADEAVTRTWTWAWTR